MSDRISASGAAGPISRDQGVLTQTSKVSAPIWSQAWNEVTARVAQLSVPQSAALAAVSLSSFGAIVGATALLFVNTSARRESRVRPMTCKASPFYATPIDLLRTNPAVFACLFSATTVP